EKEQVQTEKNGLREQKPRKPLDSAMNSSVVTLLLPSTVITTSSSLVSITSISSLSQWPMMYQKLPNPSKDANNTAPPTYSSPAACARMGVAWRKLTWLDSAR